MSRERSQLPAMRDFLGCLDTAFRIYAPARSWCKWEYESFEENPYQPKVAAKVIGLAFLGIVAAWEEFLQEAFLRYLSAYPSESGFLPKLRLTSCRNRTHAMQVLVGATNTKDKERNLRWSDYSWVSDLAHVYFQKGIPFSKVPKHYSERLQDAQIIRNRVAHNSKKARASFKVVANKLQGHPQPQALPSGFSPGLLLISSAETCFDSKWLSKHDHEWGDIFEAYVSMYVELASMLSPPKKSDG